jgi:WD40 repeat protein
MELQLLQASPVVGMAWGPGKILAVAYANGAMQIWDVGSRDLLMTWWPKGKHARPYFSLKSLTWNRAGTKLAVLSWSRSFIIDVQDGSVSELHVDVDVIEDAGTGPETVWMGGKAGLGYLTLVESSGGTWKSRTVSSVNPESSSTIVAVSPDTKLAVVGSSGGLARMMWLAPAKGPPVRFDVDDGLVFADIKSLSIAPGGRYIAGLIRDKSFEEESRIALFGCDDAGCSKREAIVPTAEGLHSVAFTSDASRLLASGSRLLAWDVTTRDLAWSVRPDTWVPGSSQFTTLAVARDEQLGAVSTNTGVLAIFDSRGRLLYTLDETVSYYGGLPRFEYAKGNVPRSLMLEHPARRIRWPLDVNGEPSADSISVPDEFDHVLLDSAGRRVSYDIVQDARCPNGFGALVVHRLHPVKQSRSPAAAVCVPEGIDRVMFNPDSERAVVPVPAPSAKTEEEEDDEKSDQLLQLISFPSGSRRVLSGSRGFRLGSLSTDFISAMRFEGEDSLMRIWDGQTEKLLGEVRFPSGNLLDFNFSGAARSGNTLFIATGSDVATWSIRPWKQLKSVSLDERISALTTVSGKALVGTATGQLAIIDSKVRSTPPSGAAITWIVAAKDGSLAATLSSDHIARLWDLRSMTLRASLIVLSDGRYFTLTPGGALSGLEATDPLIGLVYDKPREVYRATHVRGAYQPRIARERLAGNSSAELTWSVPRPPRVVTQDRVLDVSGAQAQVRLTVHTATPATVQWTVEGRPGGPPVQACAGSSEIILPVQAMSRINLVRIVATDADGSMSKETTLTIRRTDEMPPRRLWLVSLGVGRYPHLQGKDLPLAPFDAKAVATAFTRQVELGLFSWGSPPDVLPQDAMPQRIESSLLKLQEMGPDDLGIVFLSGHGTSDAPGELVFLTSLVELKNGTLTPESEPHLLSWTSVARSLASVKGHLLVLLDACHAGAAGGSSNKDIATALAGAGNPNVVVLAASRSDQQSYEVSFETDGNEPQLNSLFVTALKNALTRADTDRNGDGALQLSEVVEMLAREVNSESQGRQTPVLFPPEADLTIAVPAQLAQPQAP